MLFEVLGATAVDNVGEFGDFKARRAAEKSEVTTL